MIDEEFVSLIEVYYKGNLVLRIERVDVEAFLLFHFKLNEDNNLPPTFYTLRKRTEEGFYVYFHEDGIWIMKDDEIVPIAIDELVCLINNEEVRIIEWEKEKKEKAWWLGYKNVYDSLGIDLKINFKDLPDEDIKHIINKVKKPNKKRRKSDDIMGEDT